MIVTFTQTINLAVVEALGVKTYSEIDTISSSVVMMIRLMSIVGDPLSDDNDINYALQDTFGQSGQDFSKFVAQLKKMLFTDSPYKLMQSIVDGGSEQGVISSTTLIHFYVREQVEPITYVSISFLGEQADVVECGSFNSGKYSPLVHVQL